MRRFIVGTTVGVIGAYSARRAFKGARTIQGVAEPRNRGLLTESARTGPLARGAFRSLDRLYAVGVGRFLGHRFLRLTHRGRKSGRLYHTVVEVIDYDPVTRESVVASGWGDRADWYRNIRAAPAIEIATADERYAPVQRFLDSAELYSHLRVYMRRHRLLAPLVRRTLGLRVDGSSADRQALDSHGYRAVAFRPFQPERVQR